MPQLRVRNVICEEEEIPLAEENDALIEGLDEVVHSIYHRLTTEVVAQKER